MPNPNATSVNGPDVTIPRFLYLTGLGAGQTVLYIDSELIVRASNITLTTLELLQNVQVLPVPGSIWQRDTDGKAFAAALELSGLATIGGGAVLFGEGEPGKVVAISLFNAPDRIGLVIRAADGQTAELQKWANLDGDAYSWMDAIGRLFANGITVRSGTVITIPDAPTVNTDGANKKYVDDSIAASSLSASHSGTYNIPVSTISGSVTGLGLSFTPTKVELTIGKEELDDFIMVAYINGSATSGGFNFELSATTLTGDYVLHYTLKP